MDILKQVLTDLDNGKDINTIDYGVDKNRLGSLLEDAKRNGYLSNVNVIRVGGDNHVNTVICNGITDKGYKIIGE